jgi:putative flippase GtrA
LNNLFTYRDRRLRGLALATGCCTSMRSAVSALPQTSGFAAHLFDANHSWWLAGLGGAAIGAVWNYAMSSVFVWGSCAPAPPVPDQAQVTTAEQSAAGRSSLSPSAA